MKIKAPFQAVQEHAGQGFTGQRSYFLSRWVLRAYIPMYDRFGVPRTWRWPFVCHLGKPFRQYVQQLGGQPQ